MATRQIIGKKMLLDNTAHYEYGTRRFIMPGISFQWKTRRKVYTQVWEAYILNNGRTNTDPIVDVNEVSSGDDWKVEEVVESRTRQSPFFIIHRETWTRRDDWEIIEE